jgi:hypothetical protein
MPSCLSSGGPIRLRESEFKCAQSGKNIDKWFADVCMDWMANTFSLLVKMIVLGIRLICLNISFCSDTDKNCSRMDIEGFVHLEYPRK